MSEELKYTFVEYDVVEYICRDKKTGEAYLTKCTNRNNLSQRDHLKLLNLNDDENEYFASTKENRELYLGKGN